MSRKLYIFILTFVLFEIWNHIFKLRSIKEKLHLVNSQTNQFATELNRTQRFQKLVDCYLAPWKVYEILHIQVRIEADAFDYMEPLLRMGGFRVRLHKNRVFYRVVGHWHQTYRNQRMEWILAFLSELVQPNNLSGLTLAHMKLLQYEDPIEFIINVGDGPRVTTDSISGLLAGLPIFSFRTSSLHADIPIPDPVEFGSNGNYSWDDFEEISKSPASLNGTVDEKEQVVYWQQKDDRVVFRGSSSCFHLNANNWYLCTRVLLSRISDLYPDLVDAGITSWIKLSPEISVEELQARTGASLRSFKTHREESRYKYILDVDGGLGSSRKRGILSSGSVLFAQTSMWKQWYEPLLIPFYHYIPVSHNMEDLIERVLWARKNDANLKLISQQALEFSSEILSIEAIQEYWSILLLAYTKLLHRIPSLDTNVTYEPCLTNKSPIENGPMGCSKQWFEYKKDTKIPFGCRFSKKSYPQHFCWRQIPGKSKETKFGVESSYNSSWK
eukprot:jgi/Galph1/148/GphlegSOOS_G4975.1